LEFYLYLVLALGINLLMFIPAFIFKTDRLTDISYALSFVILVAIAWIIQPFSLENTLVALMVTLWAIRLGSFLFIRIGKMKRDKRFDGRRESFTKFLSFWSLQGITVGIVLIPTLLFMEKTNKSTLNVGIVIWLIGFLIETIADAQKFRFKQDPANKGKFIDRGLWRLSRHPNYFGEIVIWVGIYIYAFTGFSLPEKFLSFVGPLYLIVLLLFVSGIPTLEKRAKEKFGNNPAYLEYKRRTSILIPWFKKR
jgi:steroid 5-alpha reductase family enzyme